MFQMRVITGNNALTRYNNIATKDPLTFYICQTGEGFLGSTQLFGQEIEDSVHIINTAGDHTSDIENNKIYALIVDGVTVGIDNESQPIVYQQGLYLGKIANGSTVLENFTYKSISQYIVERGVKSLLVSDGNGGFTVEGVAGSNTEIPTTKAVVDYVTTFINSQSILQAQFFKGVQAYTVTANDIADQDGTTGDAPFADLLTPTNQFSDCHEGDVGLIFTLDKVKSDTIADDIHYFVNLHALLQLYDVADTNTIDLTITNKAGANHTKEIKADLKIKTGEQSLKVDNVNGGVYLHKTVVTEENGVITDTGIVDNVSTASDSKLVTEKSLIEFLNKNFVKYQVIEGSGADPVNPPVDNPEIPL